MLSLSDKMIDNVACLCVLLHILAGGLQVSNKEFRHGLDPGRIVQKQSDLECKSVF